MQLIIRYEFRDIYLEGKEFYVTSFFKKFFSKLKLENPNIDFVVKPDPTYVSTGQGGTYSLMSLSIINPTNNKYILISFFDNWKNHFMKNMGWDGENMCQFFYPGGFNYYDYFTFKDISKNNNDLSFPKNIEGVYNSFYYGPYFDCCYDEMNSIYENKNLLGKNLHFRGWLWDFRKNLIDGITSDDIKIFEKNAGGQNFGFIEFLNDIKKHGVALSLPGANEVCNRDIECFAIGVPVIRPTINVAYDDPLIPNYHYISCYGSCDYTIDGNPKYTSYDDFKKNLLQTWNRVKNNKEYLEFVGNNGKKWFDKNCTINNNVDTVLKKLNLNLLI